MASPFLLSTNSGYSFSLRLGLSIIKVVCMACPKAIKIFLSILMCSCITSVGQAQSEAECMIKLLQEYVQFPSLHGHEKPAGQYLARYAQSRGLYVKVLTDQDSCYNLAISLYPLDEQKPNILLLSHIDVVDPGPASEWKYPPFSGTVTGDTIWGRGALDNKSNTIMHLFALIELAKTREKTNFDHNVTLLVMSDEENGGEKGAQLIAEQFLDLLNPVLGIGEGPHGINQVFPKNPGTYVHTIAVSNKTKLLLEVESKNPGEQLHACLTAPRSANNKMIQALHKLKNIRQRIVFNEVTVAMLKVFGSQEKGIKSFLLKHPVLFKGLLKPAIRHFPELFPFFSNTHNITRLENPGLSSDNVIPGYSKAIIDCRLQPHFSIDKFIRRFSQNICPRLVTIKSKYQALQQKNSPMENIYYHNISEALKAIFPDGVIMPAQMPYSTDCQYFRSKNIPVYSFTPVRLPPSMPKSAHSTNEHFLLSTLMPGKNAYVTILKILIQKEAA